MTFGDVLVLISDVLSLRLFEVGGTPITVATVVTVLLILLATVVVSRVVQRAVRAMLHRRGVTNEGTIGTICGVLNYSILVIGLGVALETGGIDVGTLFAAGALFAVAIGFGMQNIAQNFVSGIILLTERAIKPGDVLELDGVVVRVIQMGIRATIVQTRDGENLIVPNAVLVQASVKNFTLRDSAYRIRAIVGVVYGADMLQVREVLERVAAEFPNQEEGREPQVFMVQFGSSSVDWEVAVWMGDPWRARAAMSKLHEAIWWALKEAGITIAFPQVDVHFDPPIVEGLRALPAP